MRSFVRYPTSVPIELRLGDVVADESSYLNNVSRGGLSFNAMMPVEAGSLIDLRIPPNRPLFKVLGKVMWCRKVGFYYEVGVEFVGTDREMRSQLVAMACEIEIYRVDQASRGRPLKGPEAAIEWIERHGERFIAASGDSTPGHPEPA